MQVTYAMGTDAAPYHHRHFCNFVWQQPGLSLLPKAAETWTQHLSTPGQHLSNVFLSIWDELVSSKLSWFMASLLHNTVSGCTSGCNGVGFRVKWQWFSKVLPSPWGFIDHGRTTVSFIVLPEGVEVITVVFVIGLYTLRFPPTPTVTIINSVHVKGPDWSIILLT